MLQENLVTEAVSNEDDIKIKHDQACDTEPSDDIFSGDETRLSVQSDAKSSSGYRSGSSIDMSETVQQPDKSMFVYGTAAVSRSHDLEQVDGTILGSTEDADSKWPNLCVQVPHAVVIS